MGSQLLPGAKEFVQRVSQYMPIDIVTNGITTVQNGRLRGSAIKNGISNLWISEEAGHAKPHPKMIELAIEKHGTAPEKVVMLGDSLRADVGAAKAAGIDSIWITNEKQSKNKATYQVSSLLEAEKIILQKER